MKNKILKTDINKYIQRLILPTKKASDALNKYKIDFSLNFKISNGYYWTYDFFNDYIEKLNIAEVIRTIEGGNNILIYDCPIQLQKIIIKIFKD